MGQIVFAELVFLLGLNLFQGSLVIHCLGIFLKFIIEKLDGLAASKHLALLDQVFLLLVDL